MPRSRLLLIFLLLFIATLGIVYYEMQDSPQKAEEALHAQHISVTRNNFIEEIEERHVDNVHNFIVTGMHAGTQNKSGVSGLMAAVISGDDAIFAMLMATLPSEPQQALPLINLQDNNGNTALSESVAHGNTSMMNTLLEHGAETLTANQSMETPLMVAIKNKREDLIMPLINAEMKQHQEVHSVVMQDSNGDTPFVYAIRQENPRIMQMLQDTKMDVMAPDNAGATPLMAAAETGNEAIATTLINAGAKVDVADRFGNTPLIIAIRHKHPAFAKFLLAHGADPDFHGANGIFPLEATMEPDHADPDMFNYLLARSKQTSLIASPLLFNAVDSKNLELTKTLLGMGLNPNVADSKGETLLYHAIEVGNEDIVLLLIDKGADINRTGVGGITMLAAAVSHDETKVVKRLLDMGAQAEQKTGEGYTLAEMAVYRGYPNALDALLAHGAKLQKDFAILWSIRDGGGRAVPVLLNYGANPDVVNVNGDPALLLAAALGEVEAVNGFITHKATLDAPNKAQGISALAAAAHAGQLATTKALVENGAQLERGDNEGMTALAHAAYMSHPDVVEYLISKGANTNATDTKNRSVSDLAAISNASPARDKVLTLLQKSGATSAVKQPAPSIATPAPTPTPTPTPVSEVPAPR